MHTFVPEADSGTKIWENAGRVIHVTLFVHSLSDVIPCVLYLFTIPNQHP